MYLKSPALPGNILLTQENKYSMLRILPWITDGASTFLDGYIYQKSRKGSPVRVFEFGCGNSTLYFLSKGCIVDAVDHDIKWVTTIEKTSEAFSYSERLNIMFGGRPYDDKYNNQDYDIISIDGRDRVKCLRRVLELGISDGAILLLDNSERVDEKYSEYIDLLKGFQFIHFDQPCVPGVSPKMGNYVDRSGNRVRHRWVTTVAYRGDNMMFTINGKSFWGKTV